MTRTVRSEIHTDRVDTAFVNAHKRSKCAMALDDWPLAASDSVHASTDPTNTLSRNSNYSNDWGRSSASTTQRHADRRSTYLLV